MKEVQVWGKVQVHQVIYPLAEDSVSMLQLPTSHLTITDTRPPRAHALTFIFYYLHPELLQHTRVCYLGLHSH